MLKIKRTGLQSEYKVVGHNWDEANGGIYIRKSFEDGLWYDSYTGVFYETLSSAKAEVFTALEFDGLAD
jgi:hypothetical protein